MLKKYMDIENWTKAKLEGELEKLEPTVNQMRSQLNKLQNNNAYSFSNNEWTCGASNGVLTYNTT